MGVIYVVLTLDTEVSKYLESLHIEFPLGSSRNPTAKEVRATCSALTDLKVQIFEPPGHAWQIFIQGRGNPDRGPWALLNIANYNGDENAPHELGFEKGSPELILRIVRDLTFHCGPLAVLPDTGEAPVVVNRDRDVRTPSRWVGTYATTLRVMEGSAWHQHKVDPGCS